MSKNISKNEFVSQMEPMMPSDNIVDQPQKRALQEEAKSHIEVQKLIDEASDLSQLVSEKFICSIHQEFFKHLPEEMCWIEDPDTKRKVKIIPGKLREEMVAVGRHVPPLPQNVSRFLSRFEETYRPDQFSKVRQVLAVAASHHRLVWIHPFLDGNGRVARLFSHAL